MEVKYDNRSAHPRSRGENLRSCRPGSKHPGSSPLTRGKRQVCAGGDLVGGLIPAHAGKTRPPAAPTETAPAHPRSRGENASSMPRAREMPGSSPLTRGKPIRVRWPFLTLRLIPAHAGKTGCEFIERVISGAHPRSRGENQVHAIRQQITAGSSPLTRGKRQVCAGGDLVGGLIPAHAGKTDSFYP